MGSVQEQYKIPGFFYCSRNKSFMVKKRLSEGNRHMFRGSKKKYCHTFRRKITRLPTRNQSRFLEAFRHDSLKDSTTFLSYLQRYLQYFCFHHIFSSSEKISYEISKLLKSKSLNRGKQNLSLNSRTLNYAQNI